MAAVARIEKVDARTSTTTGISIPLRGETQRSEKKNERRILGKVRKRKEVDYDMQKGLGKYREKFGK